MLIWPAMSTLSRLPSLSVGRVHLTEQTRIALSVVPAGDGASAAIPDSEPVKVA